MFITRVTKGKVTVDTVVEGVNLDADHKFKEVITLLQQMLKKRGSLDI